MSQQIIDIGAEANDGTGEPLRSAFNAVNENFTEVYAAGPVGSNVTITGNTITVSGINNNLVLAANGIGNVQSNSTIMPSIDSVYDIGAANMRFGDIHGTYIYGNGAFLTGIAGGSGSGNAITSGATSVAIPIIDGNVAVTIDGRGNVMVVQRQNVVLAANLIPSANVTYSLGSATAAWQDLYLSNSTIFLGNSTIRSNASSFTLTTNTGSLILQGNGTVSPYANANVAAFLPTNTSNIRGGNITATGNISAAGNVTGQYIIGDGGFLSNIVFTGNVAVSQLGNGTTVLRVDGAGGNIISTVGGASNVQVVTPTGVAVIGNISATGNITGDYILGNGSQLTGMPPPYANSNVEAYLLTNTGNIAAGNLTVTSNIAAGNIATSGNINTIGNVNTQGAVHALGNIVTEGFFIGNFQGNVTGNLTVPGSNTQVIFNGEGNAAAAAGFTFNSDSNTVGVLGIVSAQGNVIAGNVNTAGNVTADYFVGNGSALTSVTAANIVGTVATAAQVTDAAQPNITSVGTLTTLTVSGNIDAARLIVNNISSDDSSILIIDDGLEVNGDIVAGNISANFYVGNGSQLTGMYSNTDVEAYLPTYTGNLAALTGNVTTTANVSANYVLGNGSQLASVNAVSVLGAVPSTAANADSLTLRDSTGNITANYFVGNGSQLTGMYSNTEVAEFLPTYTGNLVSLTGDVTTTANVSGNFILGNGSQLTGLPETYANANVQAFLPTYTGNLTALTGNVTTTANISGSFLLGNGAFISGLPAGYSNAEVATFLASGNNSANIVTTANISGSFLLGNGAFISGLPANYGNTEVAEFLPTYTGNLVSLTGDVTTTANISGSNIVTSGNVSATANITGSFFFGNGSQLTGVVSSYGNANVEAYLPTYTGNLAALTGNVTTTANVNSGNIVTSGVVQSGTVTAVGNAVVGNLTTSNAVNTGTLNTTGNAIVGGDLIVNGNLTYINVTDFNVEDPIIGLGRGANNAPLTANDGKDRGEQLWYYAGSEQSAFVGYNNSAGKMIVAANVSIADEIVTVNSYGNTVVGNLEATTVTATANITGNFFLGNGSQLTGIVSSYGNANVAANLAAFGSNPIVTTGNITVGTVILANGTVIKDTAGNAVSIGVNAGTNSQGNRAVAIGLRAGETSQGVGGVAIGEQAGQTSQGVLSVAIGYLAGANAQSFSAVAIGAQAGETAQGSGAIAIGDLAGRTGQGNNSIILNATGANLDQTTANTFTVAPVRNDVANVGEVLFYNTTSKEITYGNTISIVGNISTSSNVSAANVNTGFVSATGNVDSLNINTDNIYADVISVVGNVDSGNVNTVGQVSATGNITGGNVNTVLISATTANVSGTITGGNISTAGTVTATGTITGGNLVTAGTASATGTITGGNLVTDGTITATGNINGGNIVTSNSISGLHLFASGNVSAVGNVISGNIVSQGIASVTGNVTAGNISTAGLITATGTITSVDTITGGNLVSTAQISSAGNITAAGNVLATNFIGNLVGNLTAPGANTQLIFNQDGVLGGTSGLVFDYVGNALTVGGDIATQNGGNISVAGALSVTGNVTVSTGNINGGNILGTFVGITGNIVATNNIEALSTIIAGGNITGGNLLTTGAVLATGNVAAVGNVSGGNVLASGIVSTVGNVTGGNLVTTGQLVAIGNAEGGNINTSGLISATGNIIGGSILTSGVITATGNISSLANIVASGNISAGNVIASNLTATRVVFVGTGGVLSDASGFEFATGNSTLSVANIATGIVTATGNVDAGNLISAGIVSAAGNVTGGNLLAATLSLSGNVLSALNMITNITTTGNISANNIAATTSINIAGNPVATVDDATALAIALG